MIKYIQASHRLLRGRRSVHAVESKLAACTGFLPVSGDQEHRYKSRFAGQGYADRN